MSSQRAEYRHVEVRQSSWSMAGYAAVSRHDSVRRAQSIDAAMVCGYPNRACCVTAELQAGQPGSECCGGATGRTARSASEVPRIVRRPVDLVVGLPVPSVGRQIGLAEY